MGGSPKQVNSGQASAADAGANAAAQASANLSAENQREQTQNYNYLFGEDGKSGSLSKFMDPSSLNVSGPTGAYKTIYNNASNQLTQNYNQQRGSLAQTFANQGFAGGMPNGFMADQERKLSQGQADSRGNLFTNAAGNSYQDALSNFWNATNIASGQASDARAGALSGSQAAGNDYTNIYGTAGRQAVPSNIPGAAIGAGGTVGAALACPGRGSRIGVRDGDWPVEDLEKNEQILQFGPGYCFATLKKRPAPIKVPGVRITRNDHKSSVVSATHAYALNKGGYCYAHEALHREIKARDGYRVIVAVEPIGEIEVYPLEAGGNHTYLCDDLWSLE